MAYIPLASPSDMQSGPLSDLVRDFEALDLLNLTQRASMAVEAMCLRRLSPFVVTETQRAQAIDTDEAADVYFPLEQTAQLGMSRAQSLGSSQLVRHVWVREYPPLWVDQWVGAINSVVILRSFAGAQTIPAGTAQWQFEPDTGHVRFQLGTYIPQGSTVAITYSGGYAPAPGDLVEATRLMAGILALTELDPEAADRNNVDANQMNGMIERLLGPYVREHR